MTRGGLFDTEEMNSGHTDPRATRGVHSSGLTKNTRRCGYSYLIQDTWHFVSQTVPDAATKDHQRGWLCDLKDPKTNRKVGFLLNVQCFRAIIKSNCCEVRGHLYYVIAPHAIISMLRRINNGVGK